MKAFRLFEICRVLACLSLALFSVDRVLGQTILTSSPWESAADGSGVSGSWSQQSGGGSSPAASTVTITTYQSEKWALVDNAATNEGGGNPKLQGTFGSTTAALNISFDYIIPENYGASSQIEFGVFQFKDNVATQAIRIHLGRNFAISGLSYVDSTNTRQAVGHTFTAGEKVAISLTNVSVATHTYDLSWSSSAGVSGSVTGASFTNTGVTQLTYINFGENSAVTSTSRLYVNDVVVALAPIPEPAHACVLLSGAALVAGLAVRRRSKA